MLAIYLHISEKMKNNIKKIFRHPFFENILIFLLDLKLKFVKKLIPQNTLYQKHSIRTKKKNGIYFTLDLSDYQEHLVYFNLEENSTKPLLNLIPSIDGTIIDVGANIGQTSLWIAQFFEQKNITIFSFEPYPSTFKKLEENIRLNKYRNIQIFNVALGNNEGELEMVEDCDTNSGGFRAYNPDFHQEVKKTTVVKIKKLDQYLNELNDVVFVKIDVEGFEMEVLKGAKGLLSKYRPKLFIELIDKNLKAQNSSSIELVNFLHEIGYNNFTNASNNLRIDVSKLENAHFDLICY